MHRKSISFVLFLDSSATFFLGEWTHAFWARPLKMAHGFFFRPFVLRFGCVLEETHGTTYSLEVVRKVLEEGQKL